MNVVEDQTQPASGLIARGIHWMKWAVVGCMTGAEPRPLCIGRSVIVLVELPANLSARKIAGPRVGRSDAVVRVHVDVGEASPDRIE